MNIFELQSLAYAMNYISMPKGESLQAVVTLVMALISVWSSHNSQTFGAGMKSFVPKGFSRLNENLDA